MSIGNKVGFVSGDNFSDEVSVGVWQDNVMALHRDDLSKSIPYTLIFTRN